MKLLPMQSSPVPRYLIPLKIRKQYPTLIELYLLNFKVYKESARG